MDDQRKIGRKLLETATEGFQNNLRKIFFTAWNKRLLVVLSIVGVLAPIIYHNETVAPTYRARTSIIFQETSQPIKSFDVTEALFSKRSYITNKIQEIKSRTLTEKVVAELPDSIRALYRTKDLLGGSAVERFTVIEIRKNISATSIRNTDIINITVTSTDPVAAMIIANTVTKVLRESSLEVKRTEIILVRKYIEDQLVLVKAKLHLAEERLKEYKEKEKVTVLDQESYEILRRVTAAEILHNRALSEVGSIGEQLRYIEGEINRQRSDVIQAVTQITSSYINRLKSNLVELELQLNELELQKYDENHPKMRELSGKIEETKDNLTTEVLKIAEGENLIDPVSQIRNLLQKQIFLRAEFVTYQAKAKDIKKVINNYNSELSNLPEKELNVARLQRDKAVNDNIYMMLLQKREEARILEEGRIGNIRVIDEAILNTNPIAPSKTMNIIIGMIVGSVLGVGITLFLDSMDTSLRSSADIENKTGLFVLATIPTIRLKGLNHRKLGDTPDRRGLGRNGSEDVKIREHLIAYRDPKSPVSETYRSLRTNLQFAGVEKHVKSIIISSGNPGEGKSTTVANLAISTAQMGRKTLLVDADLRKPVIHSLFGFQKHPGLIDALMNTNYKDEFTQKTEIDNLWILTCGTTPPNPSEMLGSNAMTELHNHLLSEFDYIFYDTSPIIVVTDPVVLNTIVDSLALVVKYGETTAQSVLHVKNLLAQVNTTVTGIILNKVDIRNRYGHYDYYHYYDQHYSGYGDGQEGYGSGERSEDKENGVKSKK